MAKKSTNKKQYSASKAAQKVEEPAVASYKAKRPKLKVLKNDILSSMDDASILKLISASRAGQKGF